MSEDLAAGCGELHLPSLEDLADELRGLVARNDAAARCLEASNTGVFRHPDGSEEALGMIRVSPAALALIAHLSRNSATGLSLDIGFGMGTSSTMALAARSDLGDRFTHLSFDPWGLGGDGSSGRLVQRFLEERFPAEFRRVWKQSQIGLAQLIDVMGDGCAGYIFIDGNHTYEQVMVDFFLADQLCALGGYILFDDSHFPAIEAVIEYIRTNRPDYALNHLPVPNTSVVRKIGAARPAWDAFEPFTVPDRRGWTPSVPNWNADLPPPRQAA